jgi:hypothetical protein
MQIFEEIKRDCVGDKEKLLLVLPLLWEGEHEQRHWELTADATLFMRCCFVGEQKPESRFYCVLHACMLLFEATEIEETMGSIFLGCICCTFRREHRGSMNLFCLVVYAAWESREDPAVLLGIWKQRKHREQRFLGSLYNRRMLPRSATDFGRSYKESSSEVSCHVERMQTPRPTAPQMGAKLCKVWWNSV